MVKKLEWTNPVLVELGSARRMTFGDDIGTDASCHVGTGASTCTGGNQIIEV